MIRVNSGIWLCRNDSTKHLSRIIIIIITTTTNIWAASFVEQRSSVSLLQ